MQQSPSSNSATPVVRRSYRKSSQAIRSTGIAPWTAAAAWALLSLSPPLAHCSQTSGGQVTSEPLYPKINVTTYHYDNARTGLNPHEFYLKPLNVHAIDFGKLFTHAVDGFVYAAPLVAANITIQGQGVHNGRHDVVYVATEHDSIYAFDANDAKGPNADPLWAVHLLDAGGSSVSSGEVGSGDIVPEIGITGTPVIDMSTHTMYLIAKTKENEAYVQRLHALDLGTGSEKFGGPVEIGASVPGTGDGSIVQNGKSIVPFDPLREHNRPGLLLVNGVVYIAWASHGDNGPYHGWVMAYDATSLKQLAVHNTTPNGGLGGIWMSGDGLATDGASIYYISGNGSFDAKNAGGKNYGDSFVRLDAATLAVKDYFAPFNEHDLDVVDADLGSGGLLLLPDSAGSKAHPHLIVGAGKEGKIYLLDRSAMGHYHAGTDTQIVQSVAGQVGGMWSKPAFFNRTLYYCGAGDVLKAFPLNNARIYPASSVSSIALGYPGATPVISSNGAYNGIVWLLQTDAYGSSGPAVLRAYDAANVARELWDSSQTKADTLEGAVKFSVPTVANGKVYVGTQTTLAVFGQLRRQRQQYTPER